MKYYIDTCIWFDYFENRQDNFRPLGEWAIQLINKIIDEEGIFIFTDILIKELKTYYVEEKIKSFLDIIPSQLIKFVKVKNYDLEEAKNIKLKYKIPLGDALHIVLSRHLNAVLISRDSHFFIIDEVECYKPEDLI